MNDSFTTLQKTVDLSKELPGLEPQKLHTIKQMRYSGGEN